MRSSETDIVIPVHNAGTYLERCVEHLYKHTKNFRLILINDYSDHPTTAVIHEALKRDKRNLVVTTHRQLFFTRAVNIGLALVRTPFAVVLNSDTEPGAGWLAELYGCKTEAEYSTKDEIHPIGLVGSVHTPGADRRWAFVHEPNYVTGHCWLLDMDKAARVAKQRGTPGAFLDETRQDSIHINSDRTFCYDLNRCGYSTIISYKSHVYHVDGGGKSWNHDLASISRVKLSDVD